MLHSPCLVSSNLSVDRLKGVVVFFFWLCNMACGILFPDQGLNPHPQQWNLGVLTTGLPGESLHPTLLKHHLQPTEVRCHYVHFAVEETGLERGSSRSRSPAEKRQSQIWLKKSRFLHLWGCHPKLSHPRSATLASSPSYHNSCSAATAVWFGPGFTCTCLSFPLDGSVSESKIHLTHHGPYSSPVQMWKWVFAEWKSLYLSRLSVLSLSIHPSIHIHTHR